jgi:hypothetical protein
MILMRVKLTPGRIILIMRRKGPLCLLALLLLFAGYLLISNPGSAPSVLPHSSTLNARSLAHSTVAENAPGLEEDLEPHAILSGSLPIHSLVWGANNNHLLLITESKSSEVNASLLVMIARALGLSSLVLRE